MIKNKLIALTSTLALASVICVATAVSANAANVELNYNEDLSTATVKVIDVDYSLDGPLTTLGGVFYVDCEGATMKYNCLVNYDATLTSTGTQASLDWADVGPNGDVAASGTHGQLSITVPEGTSEFDVRFGEVVAMDLDWNVFETDITITVPAFVTEPDKDPFVSATAEYLGRYDTDKTSVPVDAWTATIDWSSYEAAKALNWTLSVNGEEKSVAAATQTEITGEMTVVYGLAIAGQAEAELNTIDKDNVVLK